MLGHRNERSIAYMSQPFAAGLLAASAAWYGSAMAQQTDGQPAADGDRVSAFGINVGAGASDNLLRSTSNEESGSYTSIGFVVDLARSTRRLEADLSGDVEYQDYSESNVEDQPVGFFDASLEIHALPDRVSWIIEERYGQGRTNPFRADGPNNREEINVFTTGPRFQFPLGARTAVRLTALVGERSFEDSVLLESDSARGELGLIRALSPTAEFGFYVSHREAEYDFLPVSDNDIDSAYFSYQKTLVSGTAAVSIGGTRVDYGLTESSAPYFDLVWNRDVGARSNLSISLQNRFVDAAENFAVSGGLNFNEQAFDNVLLSADVYESAAARLLFSIERGRSSFFIGADLLSKDYENAIELNNDQIELNLGVERAFTTEIDGGLAIYVSEREFEQSTRQDEDETARIWVRKRFSRKVELEFSYADYSRGGRNADDFNESLFEVALQYNVSP